MKKTNKPIHFLKLRPLYDFNWIINSTENGESAYAFIADYLW